PAKNQVCCLPFGGFALGIFCCEVILCLRRLPFGKSISLSSQQFAFESLWRNRLLHDCSQTFPPGPLQNLQPGTVEGIDPVRIPEAAFEDQFTEFSAEGQRDICRFGTRSALGQP